MWERGDKTNQGIPELNGSSVGIAKVQETQIVFIVVSIYCVINDTLTETKRRKCCVKHVLAHGCAC